MTVTIENISVEYIDHMGSDLTVVNAARTSHDRSSEWDFDGDEKVLKDKDVRLIHYLDDHGHWTPFSHTAVTFRIKAPIFVARQLVRHVVGLTWNEVSRRYVADNISFYIPENWRKRIPDVKQGSSQTEFVDESDLVLNTMIGGKDVSMNFNEYLEVTLAMYNRMLDSGVAPELARIVLPHNLMTQWYWTGNVASWARVCNLRLDSHAQYESRLVAEQISSVMSDLFPVSWDKMVLKKGR